MLSFILLKYLTNSSAYGQLGIGKINTLCVFTPALISLGTKAAKVVQIEAGPKHSIVLLDNGRVYAFGWNGYYQLALGQCDDIFTPTEINLNFLTLGAEHEKIIKISSGWWHTLFLSNLGYVYSVGWAKSGQLGLSICEDTVLVPKRIDYFTQNKIHVIDCSCGISHSVVLDNNGVAYSFGNGKWGQLAQNDLEMKEICADPHLISFSLKNKCNKIVAKYWTTFLVSKYERVDK